MPEYERTVRVAAVQAEPAWLDLDAGIEKTLRLAAEAKEKGAELVAFPETWLPGYPWFLWLGSVAWQSQFIVKYAQNSLVLGEEHWNRLAEGVRALGLTVVLGYSEREGGSLYMGQAIISPEGRTLMTRRKLKPTHVERTQFGEGDGSDVSVVDTPVGRVGALNCWEHLQPLTKYAMYAQQEQLHVAAWPSFCVMQDGAYALGAEVNVSASRVYAVEGQCFVLAPCGVIGDAAHAAFGGDPERDALLGRGGGHARIFGPDGRSLAEPLAPEEEGIIVADLDYAAILAAKNAADPVGHYSRPDVFTLQVRREGRLPKVLEVPLSGEAGAAAGAPAGAPVGVAAGTEAGEELAGLLAAAE